MALYIDDHGLLCVKTDIENNKEYMQELHGYTISDTDKLLVVLHKKQVKQVHFKDLGSGMSARYLANRMKALHESIAVKVSEKGALTALSFFKGFNEEKKSHYAFLYKYPSNNVNILNTQLGLLGIPAQALQTEDGLIVHIKQDGSNKGEPLSTMHDILSFLFVLTLLYGKLDIKEGLFYSATIHMPLFGAYLKDQHIFDTLVFTLQQQGVFLQKRIEESGNGIVYQLSIQDYEVLACFAQFYKPIANIEKIPTLDKLAYHKQLLMTYLESEALLDDSIRKILETQVLKTLEKA